ncbi:MAG: hypothetical protein WA463_00455, partial [Terriglobales bacterium]
VQPENIPDGPFRLLNIAIPRYAVPESTLDTRRAILWMQIRGVLEPAQGTAINVMTSAKETSLPPMDMRNATVEQILDRMVSGGPGGAWILYPLPPQHDWEDKLNVRFIGALSYSEERSLPQLSCEPPR